MDGLISYPITLPVMLEAMGYAIMSSSFTAHIRGFKKTSDYERYRQRFAGQCVQRLYVELLKVNKAGVISEDGTDFTQVDNFDFKVKGSVFDVKGSMYPEAPMQIPAYQEKEVDFYAYGTIDFLNKRWTPYGFIKKSTALSAGVLIKQGDPIPHMKNAPNCIDSYFVDVNKVKWHPWQRLLGKTEVIKLKRKAS